ncbi:MULTISPECIES: DUF4169 family protein [Hydrocarboniphaga]|uniref:DUF4169 family protein n=1 Tax=Hydrocarboniphaga effusa AP103 TaxID=1172194 RepID=I8T5P1_9GAMM|nr:MULTISPECIES: DUF4169 family protein [Hydrocarboniphaga]EIT69023.1 hypothetical protein WQQ_26050 [Hydrocarboniphaga effusa AP103]MDZ4081097.1 DUF4169 family protein [Hydrocarboniphaga sp.]
MAEIINFNKARKRKAREQAQAQAAENRVRFGRTKEQKQLEAAQMEEAHRKLDGLRREPGDEHTGEEGPETIDSA